MSVKISTVMRLINQLHGDKENVVTKENRALYAMWIKNADVIDPMISDVQREQFTEQKEIDEQGDTGAEEITKKLTGEVISCRAYHEKALSVLSLIEKGAPVNEIKAAYNDLRVLGGTFDPTAPRKGKSDIEQYLIYTENSVIARINGKEKEFKGQSARNNAGFFVSKELKKLS